MLHEHGSQLQPPAWVTASPVPRPPTPPRGPLPSLPQNQTYGVQLAVPERTNEVAGQYATAAETLAEELGVPCLNLWRAFQVRTGPLRSDG